MLPRNLEATGIWTIVNQAKRDPVKNYEWGGLIQMETTWY